MTDRITADLSKLGREMGFRGSAGGKNLLEDLSHDSDFELKAKRDVRFVTKEKIGEQFYRNHGEIISDTKDMVEDMGEYFREGMEEMTLEFLGTCTPAQRVVLQRAMDRGLMSPEFEIYDPKSGQEFIEDVYGWSNYEIYKDNLLVVFRLPKPVDFMWDKGTRYSGSTGATSEFWGDSYDNLISRIWDIWNYSDRTYGIDLQRINEVGEHEKGKYYYIWEISRVTR